MCMYSTHLLTAAIRPFANSLWPTYASAHNNLGTLVNNLDVAENHFLSAIMYASTHVNAHFNLGQLYL